MAQPSDVFKKDKAYFHALGAVNTIAGQSVYESKYKSGHNMRVQDIWADNVGYASTQLDADSFAQNNSDIVKLYDKVGLTVIPGSNGEGYYLSDNGLFMQGWVSPTDIPHNETMFPSMGYQAFLYRGDDNTDGKTPGSLIPPTLGAYVFDYYSGIVLFQNDKRPIDLGWGSVKVRCYVYVGKKLNASNCVTLLNIDEGETTTVDVFNDTIADGVIYEYVIKNGDKRRIGKIMATWNDDSVQHTEFSTTCLPDRGATYGVFFTVDKNVDDVRLNITVNEGFGNDWQIKAIRNFVK